MSEEIVCVCGHEMLQQQESCPKCGKELHEIVGRLWELLHYEAKRYHDLKLERVKSREAELHTALDNLQQAAVELTGQLKSDAKVDDALHLRLDRLLSEVADAQENRLKIKNLLL